MVRSDVKNFKKIAIIGYGFVGKAIEKGFSKNTEIFLVDPLLNSSIPDLIDFNPDFIFICVPTPMKEDGSQNFQIVLEVFQEIVDLEIDACVILKSTVTVDNLKKAENLLPNFVYNPEFLREKHAEFDFINSKMIIIGSKKTEQGLVKQLYLQNSNCLTKNFILTDKITASLIKYTINSFLASKVLFFNQIKDIFDSSGAEEDWNDFINILSLDERIGNSHMMVPGHDGKKGFGGACFTKDTAAMHKYSQIIGKEFKLLKTVLDLNNQIRSEYESLDDREIEQNVNYKYLKNEKAKD